MPDIGTVQVSWPTSGPSSFGIKTHGEIHHPFRCANAGTGFGRCCPRTTNCCSYGYCIDPAETCCPGGSCDPGYKCCSTTTCSPPGTECCSDGNYCQAGNICVKLFDSGRIVCCTDLKCTAAVVSGTTSYRSTSTTDIPAPTITRPPTTTRVVVDETFTWYWTVTWWYLSFYYTTFRAESTVTYTTIYSTTTFTTTASDREEASSRFAVLSRTLTFTPPASATTLASLLSALPSETQSVDVLVESTRGPTRSSSSTRTSAAFSFATTRASTTGTQGGPGSASAASNVFVQWMLLGSAALSGILMIWL